MVAPRRLLASLVESELARDNNSFRRRTRVFSSSRYSSIASAKTEENPFSPRRAANASKALRCSGLILSVVRMSLFYYMHVHVHLLKPERERIFSTTAARSKQRLIFPVTASASCFKAPIPADAVATQDSSLPRAVRLQDAAIANAGASPDAAKRTPAGARAPEVCGCGRHGMRH